MKTHTAEIFRDIDGRIVVEVSDDFDMVTTFTVNDGARLVHRIDQGLKRRNLLRISRWDTDGDLVRFDLYDVSAKVSA